MIRRLFSCDASRQRLLRENARFAAVVPAGAVVLDAGAGTSPYRDLFKHTTYESADFEQVDKTYAPPTYTCDLGNIPVEDGRFDFVIFNQVMEHLPEPKNVLAELHRVLKPGGKMIYSAPLFFEEHETPYDYYRYTQYGVQYLFHETGFDIERLEWLEGYFGTVAYQLKCMALYIPTRPNCFGGGVIGILSAMMAILFRIAAAAFSVVFNRLELRSKYMEQGHPKNYIAVVAKK